MVEKNKKQWEFLKRKFETGQLAHAYLFCGFDNLGKKDFAKQFLEFVGCKFPDLMVVEQAGEIPISKVREIQNFLSYKSYNGGYKAVILENAHLMNQEAQNCFLKTLEEPKGKTLIVLISSKPDLLLPTIFSRCQIVKFFGKPEINQKLEEQENKILLELKPILSAGLAEKFRYAKSLDFSARGGPASGWEKQSLSQILEVMQKYYRNLMLSGDSDAKRILRLIDEINFKASFTNINPKLALEVLLMEV